MLLLHELGEARRIPRARRRRDGRGPRTRCRCTSSRSTRATRRPGSIRTATSSCHCALGCMVPVLDGVRRRRRSRAAVGRSRGSCATRWRTAASTATRRAYLVTDECPSSMVGTIAPFEAMLRARRSASSARSVDRAARFLDRARAGRAARRRVHNAEEREAAPAWLPPCFPRFYFYDVLRGLGRARALGRGDAAKRCRVRAVAGVVDAPRRARSPTASCALQRQRATPARRPSLRATARARAQPASSFPLLEAASALGEPVRRPHAAVVRGAPRPAPPRRRRPPRRLAPPGRPPDCRDHGQPLGRPCDPDSSMSQLAPVPPRERLITLDVLRGFALCGVMIGNMVMLQRGVGAVRAGAGAGHARRDRRLVPQHLRPRQGADAADVAVRLRVRRPAAARRGAPRAGDGPVRAPHGGAVPVRRGARGAPVVGRRRVGLRGRRVSDARVPDGVESIAPCVGGSASSSSRRCLLKIPEVARVTPPPSSSRRSSASPPPGWRIVRTEPTAAALVGAPALRVPVQLAHRRLVLCWILGPLPARLHRRPAALVRQRRRRSPPGVPQARAVVRRDRRRHHRLRGRHLAEADPVSARPGVVGTDRSGPPSTRSGCSRSRWSTSASSCC